MPVRPVHHRRDGNSMLRIILHIFLMHQCGRVGLFNTFVRHFATLYATLLRLSAHGPHTTLPSYTKHPSGSWRGPDPSQGPKRQRHVPASRRSPRDGNGSEDRQRRNSPARADRPPRRIRRPDRPSYRRHACGRQGPRRCKAATPGMLKRKLGWLTGGRTRSGAAEKARSRPKRKGLRARNLGYRYRNGRAHDRPFALLRGVVENGERPRICRIEPSNSPSRSDPPWRRWSRARLRRRIHPLATVDDDRNVVGKHQTFRDEGFASRGQFLHIGVSVGASPRPSAISRVRLARTDCAGGFAEQADQPP